VAGLFQVAVENKPDKEPLMPEQPKQDASGQIYLDTLAVAFPHIPPACGTMLAQAAILCLDKQGHVSGVPLTVKGSHIGVYTLHWSDRVTEPMQRFWNDWDEATEQAAYAVALVLMRAVTGYTVVERSRKGTGFDWWLGNDDNIFQAKARLEVSGILRGTEKRIRTRVLAKTRQTQQSDSVQLPAHVVVVEFGKPQARMVQR
jgi:hypothetical protein